eukprot:TRINITY_DN270_c0_g2_i1.p1 TRINITY_DN270_c0_g2~~TRINITY_DN270_c0_g2_i1.p1  ORF type:complete len:197 (-),score=74.99 TRINITY_DN270_c0_g2_i1:273-842(-)
MPKKVPAIPVFKLVVAGGGGSGKSALTQMFIYGNFIEEYDPTTADNYDKTITLEGQKMQLDIMDTAGQEDVLKNTHKTLGEGYLIVFSTVERSTIDAAQRFRDHVLTVAAKDEYPTVLVGSKIDLPGRQITTEEGQNLAKQWNCPYFETSAKTKTNVDEAFYTLVRVVEQYKRQNAAAPAAPKKNCVVM